ncbi:hypothetical protein HWV62_13285 [Athelia sp. TMB]|nr:hypothetical protein HWV62_13285 [Athelia sp. TMB]
MAPYISDTRSSDSGSDSEGIPETFSLAQSKVAALSQNDALRQAEVAEKEKRKERNRQRDRKLKERALLTGRAKVPDVDDVQARMERAMRDADAEEDSDANTSEEGENTGDEDMDGSDDSDEGSGEEDEEMLQAEEDTSDDDPEETETTSSASKNLHHLPEHLFTTAFTPTAPSGSVHAPSSRNSTLAKKRKRRTPGTKDALIGSRVVRVLGDRLQPATKTLPSSKANKFVNRSLALKGGKAPTKGWERKPGELDHIYILAWRY